MRLLSWLWPSHWTRELRQPSAPAPSGPVPNDVRRWFVLPEGEERTLTWGQPSTASRAADLLSAAAVTLKERDGTYKGSDKLYADVMALLFPDGVQLEGSRDHHRFHIFMLMMVKVTRYARNWEEGHDDSLVDLINYVAMLQAIDRDGG